MLLTFVLGRVVYKAFDESPVSSVFFLWLLFHGMGLVLWIIIDNMTVLINRYLNQLLDNR